MPYNYVPFATAKSQLALRLYDSTFWSDTERGVYIQQALRTFNSYANFWRSEFVLDSVINTHWYDISDITVAPNTLRRFTVTDVDIYKLIQYHFLEPATGAAWSGSSQFSAADLLQAVQRRRDELLSGSGCTVYKANVPAVPGRTFLPDKTIDIRRVAWIPVAGFGYSNSPLWKDDNFALESYENSYTIEAPGTPETYQQSSQPPLSFDVNIPPAVPGEYEVITVDAGSALDVSASTVMNLPDDFTWVLVFGAMADLMNRDSNAKDSLRARYCNLRYAQGLALLANAPAVMSCRINNLPTPIDSAQNMDNFRSGWQAESAGTPNVIITAGLNLIGLAPKPDAGPYGITLSVVQNAPIPVNDVDLIQVGKDEYDAVLDYAVHLASFKMGGTEFLSTIPLFERFVKQASIYNSKLSEMGEYTDIMKGISQLQAETNPVMSTADAVAPQNGV